MFVNKNKIFVNKRARFAKVAISQLNVCTPNGKAMGLRKTLPHYFQYTIIQWSHNLQIRIIYICISIYIF